MNEGLTASDVAVLSGNYGKDNNNCGFGNDGAWWIIILFLFAFCGWGGNGFGNGFGNGGVSGAVTRADLCQDMNFGQLENGVRGIQQGLCDGFYAQNTNTLTMGANLQNTIQNGFHGVDNAICNLGYNVQQGFNTTNVALMQGQNAIQTQLSQCCCENRQGQADIKYQMASDSCALQNTIHNTTRDIIDNNNANTRSIMDFLVNDKISNLQSENQNLRLAASQAAQNQYLVNELRPVARPAYITCNPYTASFGYPVPTFNAGCGCTSGNNACC